MGSVLVVDDEIDICILLTKHLGALGASADYALTIQSAIAKTVTGAYDLYIIDLNLTDGSGYDLIQKLKLMRLPSKIILITAYDGENKKAIEHGADYFIPKPLSKKLLDQALQAVKFV